MYRSTLNWKLPLIKQAAVVVDETTVAADLITQPDYDRYASDDPVPDGGAFESV